MSEERTLNLPTAIEKAQRAVFDANQVPPKGITRWTVMGAPLQPPFMGRDLPDGPRGRKRRVVPDVRWPNPKAYERWNEKDTNGYRWFSYLTVEQFMATVARNQGFDYELDPTQEQT